MSLSILLQNKYPGSVISRNGDIDWRPRTWDLVPLDLFLLGYLRERVCVNKPAATPKIEEVAFSSKSH